MQALYGTRLEPRSTTECAVIPNAVVHCPTANLFLQSGLMDYVAHRAAGLRMALGSGLAGGDEPFMPRVAVECLHTAKVLKVHAIPRGSQRVPTPAG